MGLMYSTNEVLINRHQLAQLPTPDPLGKRHCPEPFSEFIEEVDYSLGRQGYVINKEEFAVSADHMRLFGLMSISLKEEDWDNDWELLVGLRGSHDRSLARSLVIGTRVLVCSNLCFDSDLGLLIRRKQTTNMHMALPGMIREMVSHVPDRMMAIDTTFKRLREIEVPVAEGDAHLVDIYRTGGLSASQLGRAADEWYEGSAFVEHDEDGHTAWRLMNSCTQVLKPTPGAHVNHQIVAQRSIVQAKHFNQMAEAA